MDIAPPINEAEKRPSKLRRSCELCRASKARCCESKDDVRCQKCAREGKQCVFLEAKARPKRAKFSRMRVAEMEQKLDSLYALLASNMDMSQDAGKALSDLPSSSTAQFEQATSYDTLALPPYHSVPSRTEDFAKSFPVFSLPYLAFEDIQDVISKGIVTFEQAQKSLALFRTKAAVFPFVIVSSQLSLDVLRREHPVLLLCILTSTCQYDLNLQNVLETEARESIGQKAGVDGGKSLDILQGALVYLVWYHHYFHPESQQIYRFSQMIAAMAIDLGINLAPQENTLFNDLTVINSTFHWQPTSEEIETKRTFLGCYYLSSALCLALRKPNVLKPTSYLEECCQVLSQSRENDTDHVVPYFVRLQQLAEEAHCAFDYDTPFNSLLDSTRIEILTKMVKQKLNQIEMSFPPEIWKIASIVNFYYFLKIYVNEVGFHAKVPSPHELMVGEGNRAWYYSTARNESLISCLQASKDYLDHVLSLTSEEFSNFLLTDVFRLLYGVLVLGRFATGCDAPCLDSDYLRETSKLYYYLDALIVMVDALVTYSGKNVRPNYLWILLRLLQGSKMWYDKGTSDPTCAEFGGHGSGYMDFMTLLPTVVGRCLDSAVTIGSPDWKKNLSKPRSSYVNSGWMDMVSHWPDLSRGKPAWISTEVNGSWTNNITGDP